MVDLSVESIRWLRAALFYVIGEVFLLNVTLTEINNALHGTVCREIGKELSTKDKELLC